MEIKELAGRAMDIRRKYDELERSNYGRAWTNEEIALGFIGDIGDLAKLVLARNGVRNISAVDQKLSHELADCLWSILILSETYGVDLERAFVDAMNELEKNITSQQR